MVKPYLEDWPNFTTDELDCSHCGNENPHFGRWPFLMDNIQQLRTDMDEVFTITSGYRCPQHPIEAKKVADGGSGGYHTQAAVDIHLPSGNYHELAKRAFAMGFTGIGFKINGDWSSRFIHLDFREEHKIWSY